jgi:hypothetical protein
MFIRPLPLAVLIVASCATGALEPSSTPGNRSAAGRQPVASRIPALFQRAPWSTTTDPAGQLVHVQEQARLQFRPRSGELERTKIRVYDEATNDVGFFYGGAFAHLPPKCIYGLTVYVYPATEPLDRHLEAVRAEMTRANPDARAIRRIINLDEEHGGTGVHAGYLNDVNGLESFEGVSVFERAGWFIKYRTTIGPAADITCEQRLRTAVGGMHVPAT